MSCQVFLSSSSGAVVLIVWFYFKQVESFDQDWVIAKMVSFYDDTSMVPMLAKGAMTLLTSSKSDDELQTELFDLLGFERFELIQTLLEKRTQISASAKYPKLAIIKDELENRGMSSGGCNLINNVTIMSETEKQYLKQARKEEKKIMKAVKQLTNEDTLDFDPQALRNKREMALIEASEALLFKKSKEAAPEVHFPYVFDNYSKAKNTAGYISGQKLALPEGFTRSMDNIKEEVVIPKNDPPPPDVGANFLPISTLDEVRDL